MATGGMLLPKEREKQHHKYRRGLGHKVGNRGDYTPTYDHGLGQNKLNNLYIGKEEGWHLQDSNGKDLGALTVTVLSDANTGDKLKGPKVGSMTVMDHLMKGHYVQQHSYLKQHQRLSPSDAMSVLQDPNEKFYTHVIAEVDDKRYVHGYRGVGFDVIDGAKFEDGEPYVKMFYIPTTLKLKNEDFSRTNVVKRNGEKEPLEKLIWRLSLEHVGGRKKLTVFDAPEGELGKLENYGFKALTPKFDVPSLSAKTNKEFSQVADQVYMVVKSPEGPKANQYQYGVELQKAIELFNGYLREGYEIKNTKTVMMYDDGIAKLIDSAVKVNGKVIVPYKGVEISGAVPLERKDKEELKIDYLKKY